jgi:cytochrome c oxidase assembly factor CtaG
MSEAVRDIFADWSLPIWLTASVVLTALIYVRGWFLIRKTRRKQFGWFQLASFFGGLAVLWLAIGSPMDGFADELLSAHMVEHLLLMSVVPPLLLFGLPIVPLLRGLPRVVRKYIVAPLIRTTALRHVGHWMVIPVVAWMLMNVSFLGWHIPAAYDFALDHEYWHDVEHACFLFSSLLFWWCVLRPWPSKQLLQGWGMILYLVSADLVNTVLSAFLAFCGHPVYRYYLDHPNPFHVVALDDQVLGAVTMWVFGSLVFLVPAFFITLRLTGGSGQRHEYREESNVRAR